MMPLDREIERAVALVIDGNPTSRSLLAAQLRDLGVGEVVQASRLADGRRRLEARRYDIVICEQRFPGDEQSGQELLDDLRRTQLLPYATVFVMITGEARYEHVAEAAESALDSYVVKPYSMAILAGRLRQARRRKRELKQVFEAIEGDAFERAAGLCVQRFERRDEFWLYAARIGAELLLRTGRHGQAKALYEAVLESRPVAWARLGVARAQAEGGHTGPAQRTLEALLADEPDYADAWELLGRVQIDQGRFSDALQSCRRAADLTPGSIPRLQRRGMLAFHLGGFEESEKQLDRATLLGITSKMYDPQALVVLAFARFRLKDAKGLQRCRENLDHLAGRDATDARLARQCHVVAGLEHLQARRPADALDAARALLAEPRDPDLDLESACNVLHLLSLIASLGIATHGVESPLLELATRFATSRGSAELLARSAAPHPPFGDLVAQAHAEVSRLSESAMSHALDDRPGDTVRALLHHAGRTLNAKLADTAQRTLARHRERIADAAALQDRLDAMRSRHATAWAAPRWGQGARAAGGLTLRGSAASPASGRTESVRTGSPDRAAVLAV